MLKKIQLLFSLILLIASTNSLAGPFEVVTVEEEVRYPIEDRVSKSVRVAAAITNARKIFTSKLDQFISTKVDIKGDKAFTQLTMTTATMTKESIVQVTDKRENGYDITKVKLMFMYNPIDVTNRAKELSKNKALREKLKQAQVKNSELMQELVKTLSSGSPMSVSKALELANINIFGESGSSQEVEVTTLNEQVRGVIADKISKGAMKNNEEFINAYLPALRDSLQMTYYDVTPISHGNETYGVIDWVIDLPLMKEGDLSPVAKSLRLLPDYYQKPTDIEINGRQLTNFELINPAFLGVIGEEDGRRVLSPSTNRRNNCRKAPRPDNVITHLEELWGIDGYSGMGGRVLCRLYEAVAMPNIMLAATMKGRLMASIRWPELGVYDEIILSDIGKIDIATRSGKSVIKLPLEEIPKLGKVEVVFWVAGIDERPIIEKNVFGYSSDRTSPNASREINQALKNKRATNYPFSSFPFLATVDRSGELKEGISIMEIMPNKAERSNLGLYKTSNLADKLEFNLNNYSGKYDFIEVAYMNKDIPARFGKPANDDVSIVSLRYWEYEYSKDMMEKVIYPAISTQGIPYIELMYKHSPFNDKDKARRNTLYGNKLMGQLESINQVAAP